MASTLKVAYADKLNESGISEVAAKLKLRLLTKDQAPDGIPYPCGGIQITYFDLAGKPTAFWRYRYLEQPARKGFDALTAEARKPLRYVQPQNSETELYLPPLIDWQEVARDPTVPILITEGEFKAACACARTPYPCIGLGGVWSWKSAKRHAPMLPDFAKFKWEGRTVFIVFDSDAVTNPKVMQAENALAHALLDLGAEPRIARLPSLPDGRKCGLDDYLMAHGVEPLETLLDAVEPWQSAQELHQLNEEVVYVRDPGLILRLDTLQRMRPTDFVNHAYATRVYYEEVTAGKTTKLVQKSAPREWIKWPGRAEVPRIVYSPGDDRITETGELNMWPGWGCVPAPGNIAPWTKLLDYLFAGNVEARTWFERWCAYPIQFPGTKLYSSAVLWGLRHGTGKSLVGYTLGRIYGENFTEIEEEHLRTTHNEWAENRQFVMGDEITGGDKRGTSDRLKSMITRQKIRLNPKYIPSYTVRDCLNYYFTSNHPDSFFLEDDDRRMFIWEVVGQPMSDEFYTQVYDPWLHGDGPSHLFHHLMNLDLGDFNPKTRAMRTDSKSEMLEMGRSDLAAWIGRLREDPDSVLRIDKAVIDRELWRAEDLLSLYDPDGKGRVTVTGMARELARQGFRKAAGGNGIRTQTHGQIRVWAVKRPEYWLHCQGTECADQFDKERGVKIKPEPKKSKLRRSS